MKIPNIKNKNLHNVQSKSSAILSEQVLCLIEHPLPLVTLCTYCQAASEEGRARALRTMAQCTSRAGRAKTGVAFRTWRALVAEDKELEEKETRLVVRATRRMMAAQVR